MTESTPPPDGPTDWDGIITNAKAGNENSVIHELLEIDRRNTAFIDDLQEFGGRLRTSGLSSLFETFNIQSLCHTCIDQLMAQKQVVETAIQDPTADNVTAAREGQIAIDTAFDKFSKELESANETAEDVYHDKLDWKLTAN